MTSLSAHVWQARNGVRVTRRRRYTSTWGAARFARDTSGQADVIRVTITDDTDVVDQLDPITGTPMIGPQVAVYENGTCIKSTNPALDEGTNPNGDTTMTKTASAAKTEDTGTDVAKPKRATTSRAKAAPKPVAKKSTKAHSVPEILAMTDGAILKLDVTMRPDVTAASEHEAVVKVTSKHPYAVNYLRFLGGQRQHFPQAAMAKLPADEAKDIRTKLRMALVKACGMKKLPEVVSKPRAAAKPAAKKPAAKAAPKPAAKKAAAAKKPAASKKVAAKKPAAKKKG